MKRWTLFIWAMLMLLFACKENNTKEKKMNSNEKNEIVNALINQDIVVGHIFNFKPEVKQEWVKCFDANKFLTDVVKKVKEGNIEIYQYSTRNIGASMNDEEKNKIVEKIESVEAKSQLINNIFFEENWFLDTVNFKLKKDLKGYGLVNVKYSPEDTLKEKPIRDMLLFIRSSGKEFDKNKCELIAENVKYEFQLHENEAWTDNLDNAKFMRILFDRIKQGKTKAFDFYEGKNKELSFEKVKENLMMETDTLSGADPTNAVFLPEIIGSYIFLEDWYYDKENCSIYKEVKAVAPVAHYYKFYDNGTSDLLKKISYIVYFN